MGQFLRFLARNRSAMSASGLRFLSAASWAFFVGCAAGCTTAPFPDPPAEFRPSPARARADDCAERLTIRITVSIDAVEFPFTAYVLTTPPDGLRVVAVSDLGETLFDAEINGVRAALRTSTPTLDDDFITGVFLPDLAAALLPIPAAVTPVAWPTAGAGGMRFERGQDVVLRASADAAGTVRILRGRLGILASDIVWEGGDPPTRVSVVAVCGSYSFSASVVERTTDASPAASQAGR